MGCANCVRCICHHTGSNLKSDVSALNNGIEKDDDKTTCMLPCTIEYVFKTVTSPTGLRLGHGMSSKNFPSSVTIVYATDVGSTDWKVTIDSVVGKGRQVRILPSQLGPRISGERQLWAVG